MLSPSDFRPTVAFETMRCFNVCHTVRPRTRGAVNINKVHVRTVGYAVTAARSVIGDKNILSMSRLPDLRWALIHAAAR